MGPMSVMRESAVALKNGSESFHLVFGQNVAGFVSEVEFLKLRGFAEKEDRGSILKLRQWRIFCCHFL